MNIKQSKATMGNSKSKNHIYMNQQSSEGIPNNSQLLHDFVVIHSVEARTFNKEIPQSQESGTYAKIDKTTKEQQCPNRTEKNGSIKEIDFEWHDRASRVYVSGSFDGWKTWTPLNQCEEDKYKTTLNLDSGSCEIKFIVDGNWHHDPRYPVIDDSYGGFNNIISVE